MCAAFATSSISSTNIDQQHKAEGSAGYSIKLKSYVKKMVFGECWILTDMQSLCNSIRTKRNGSVHKHN